MAFNPWATASNTILETLAQRDVQARQEQERQRQLQLDEQRRAQQEAAIALEGTRLAQAAARDEQEQANLLAQREDRARAINAERQTAEAASSDLAGLTEMYQLAQTPEDKLRLEQQILNRGGDVAKPAVVKRPGNLAEALMAGDTDAVNAYQQAARFQAGLNDKPSGASRQVTPAQLLMAKRQAQAQAQVEARGNQIDPTDIPARAAEIEYEYLTALGVEAPAPQPIAEARAQRALSGPETPFTRPADRGGLPAGRAASGDIALSGGAPSAPAAPAQVSIPSLVRSPEDEAAIAVLREAGREVTPETIAIVKQRMAGR